MNSYKSRVAALAALLVALTACGGSSAEDQDYIDQLEADNQSLTQQVENLETEVDDLRDDIMNAHAESEAEVVEDENGADEHDEGQQSDDQTLEFGESGEFYDLLTDEYLADVTVNSIEFQYDCPYSNAYEPESGSFAVLDVTVEGNDDASEAARVSSSSFHIIDDDGHVHDPMQGSPAVYDCVDASEELPEPQPGATASGLMVMDLGADSRDVVLDHSADTITWSTEGSTNGSQSDEESDAEDEASQDDEEPVDDTVDASEDGPAHSDYPDASDIDFYNLGSTDELYANLDTLDDCEDAHMIWGGLSNAELDGEDIDQEYLSLLGGWMDTHGC